MQDLPSPALCFLVFKTAMFILRDTAIVLRVAVGDIGASTDTRRVFVGTNVPTHIVINVGTLHVVVTDDFTLGVGGVGGTVLGTLVVTRL